MPAGRPQISTQAAIIVSQDDVDTMCAQCRAEGRFAFDTEFVMEDRYEPEACLLQIATSKSVFLIDPFLDLNLQSVWELVGDPEVETVVHAGQEDLALAVQHTGNAPRRIFDVQVAAGLVGYEYPLSLLKLVQATRHILLHKSKTLTDWRKRPLAAAQLQYAAEDVQHLLEIHDLLHAKLSKLGRVDWAREEFARFEEITLYQRVEEDKIFRLKGTGAMKGRPLAVVRDVLAWRDRLAERYNRPARAVLKDHLLVEIARHGLASLEEIRDLRGINLRDSDIRRLGVVVRDALDSPSDQWPTQKPREIETPHETVLAALITAVVRSYCMEHHLAYSVVATQRSIRELIRHRAMGQPSDTDNVELLHGWRGRSVGVTLDDVLAGRRTVRIEPVDGNLAVHVTPVLPGG